MSSKDFKENKYEPLVALSCAFTEQGILIDRRILATVEDLDTAALLCFMLWLEQASREGGVDKIDTNLPWQPPEGCDEFSHWFSFVYKDAVEFFERSISKLRMQSALKFMVQKLEIVETRTRKSFPAAIEYRLNFDKLVIWMNMPRPEDLKVFQRSRPAKLDFILPKIHPMTGKMHGWYFKDSKLKKRLRTNAIAGQGQKRGLVE